MDRVELAKVLRIAYCGGNPAAEWEDEGEGFRGNILRVADKALELLAPKPAPDDTGPTLDALRSRVAQLEREAGCYAEEIAGLRKAAADRSDLASEVTGLRAKLSSAEIRADHWKRRFRDMLGIAAELAEGAK